MGDRLTEQTAYPYGDMFDRLLPEYMAIGMPYDLYWDGEYGTKRAFRKAYQTRLENERRIADQSNWYMGQYVLAAVSAAQLFVAGFNTKGNTIPEYPDKPFLEKQEELKKEEARKQYEEDQQRLAMALFQAMTTQFNKSQEQKKVTKTGQ